MKKMLHWKHMLHWRSDAFELWREVAVESRSRPAWSGFADWCSLRERGLRKQALQSLREFINQTHHWSNQTRREFADWIMCTAYRQGFPGAFLLSHPLVEDLLKPTLKEWAADETGNPAPCRWLGLLADDIDALREAIRRDPREQVARAECIGTILGRLRYAMHELPVGYIGDPEEDSALLHETTGLLTGVSLPDLQAFWQAEIAVLQELLTTYMECRETGSSVSFTRWARLWERPSEESSSHLPFPEDYRRRLCP